MPLQVDVVSAERRLYSGEANEVYARSPEGEFGILPRHQPALIALGESPVRVKTAEGEQLVFAIHSGFLEVREDHLTVLADIAEIASDIDVERARAARERALARIDAGEDTENVRGQLARANLRLRLAGAE